MICSHKWTFRLTEDSLRSYHRLQNKTDIFIEIQPLRSRNFEFSDHWIIYDPIHKKYLKYKSRQINAIDEWNPWKLGWLKIDVNGKMVMPSEFILNQYLDVNITSCEENQFIKANFNGMLAPKHMYQHGKFTYYIGGVYKPRDQKFRAFLTPLPLFM